MSKLLPEVIEASLAIARFLKPPNRSDAPV
jgi:hypothetical protein